MSAEPAEKVVDVILDVKTAGSRAQYSYLAPTRCTVGDAVLVPLGTRRVLGYVINDNVQTDLDPSKIKPVVAIIENLRLPAPLVALLQFVCRTYAVPFSVVLSAAMPPQALRHISTTWTLVSPVVDEALLSPVQREVVRMLVSEGGTYTEKASVALTQQVMRAMRLLETKGILARQVQVKMPKQVSTEAPKFRLSSDSALIDGFIRNQSKKKPAQALVIHRLKEEPGVAYTLGDLRATCGVTASSLKQLVSEKVLVEVAKGDKHAQRAPEPNPEQLLAIAAIQECIISKECTPFLLFGVTGSGKTEVYLRAAAEALRLGRQVLYLVPEIALATQAVRQLRERFGRSVALIHSELSTQERWDSWLQIATGEAGVVIGPRSAIFSPLKSIGLIIMDEEHEQAYKSESSPRYHTKSLALELGRLHQCPVVLGSATPSLESYHDAENEQLTLLSLPKRAADAQLPAVQIVDLGEGYRSGIPALFSPSLFKGIRDRLDRNEQVILFLNRRAFAPFLLCRDCGHSFVCSRCSVTLTYSRRSNQLRCHHCDHTEPAPATCPQCLGERVQPFGVGTEKVEDTIRESFPSARVERLDRDVTKRKGELERILAGFGAHEVDILVGTQMVAKGLNFPNVTLVGVIAADLSLNIPDFRATERTFQLLCQVAGRSGRGQKPGEVIVQTFSPDNVAIRAAAHHEFLELATELLTERQDAQYPPFRRLVNLTLYGPDNADVMQSADRVAAFIESEGPDCLDVLGPSPCPLERLNNQYRHHIILKSPPEWHDFDWLSGTREVLTNGVHLTIDVDAYSFM